MDTADLAKLAVAIGVPLSSAVGLVYRRFRRTGTDEIESFTRYVTQGLKYYLGRHLRRQLAAELTLRQYARVHLRSAVTGEMMVPATYPVKLKTDDAFVPLLLKEANSATVEYQDLLERSGARTVIVGEPGSGKSSLMKRVFRDACRQANRSPRNAPLPVLFELSELSRLEPEELAEIDHRRLFDECFKSVGDTAAFEAKKAVEDLQHGAGFLILLDGLDEVPREAAGKVVEAIAELAKSLSLSSPQSSLLVSTRTQHYLTVHDRAFIEAFQPLQVRAFTVADVYQFLLNWPFESDRSQNISRLFSRIRRLPSLAEMCTNPLALSMFVARDQQTEGAVSPETRSEFYSSLIDELLVNRRFRSKEDAMGRPRLKKSRERILGVACLGHLLDSDESLNSVSQERMLGAVREADQADDDAAAVLETLAVDTGLFSVEREGESYRFMHLTLCEYLAAREVVNAGEAGWAKIAERLQSGGEYWASRLGEVVSFAAGLAPDSLERRIVDDLGSGVGDGLLLRAAIEAQGYSDPRVIAAALREAEALRAIGPESWDVKWFSRLRWLLAVLRDMRASTQAELKGADAEVPTPTSFLTELIDAHGAAERLLATLARTDPVAALGIAEDSGRNGLMDIVAGASEDFAVLMAILARAESGSRQWAQALIHCALRERQIASVLSASHSDDEAGARDGGWAESFVLDGSVYGRLLDDVLDDRDGWREGDGEVLEHLARTKPPRSFVWNLMLGSGIGLMLLAAVTFVVLVTLSGWASGGRSPALSVMLAVLAVSVAGLLLLWLTQDLRETLTHLLVRRRVRALEVKVGGGGSISLQVAPERRHAGGKEERASLGLVRLWRGQVLRETLNLTAFRLGLRERAAGRAEDWRPRRLLCVVAGVPRGDIEALQAARRLRGTRGQL